MNPEQENPDIYDLGTPEQNRVRLQEEVERLEKLLNDPTLPPDKIRDAKRDLEMFKGQLKDLK
jgi:hypothetical protein